jgi:hypothetical protein
MGAPSPTSTATSRSRGGDIILCADNWPNSSGQLSIDGTLDMTGGTYDAKVGSSPRCYDQISATGTISLGGTATLTVVSINLVSDGHGGWIVQTGGMNSPILVTTVDSGNMITGNFATRNLAFNDGTGGRYTAGPPEFESDRGWYYVNS